MVVTPAPTPTAAANAEAACVDGIEPNLPRIKENLERSLMLVTALNPHIGYDRAADIVKAAAESGRSLREVALEQGVEPTVLEEALDHRRMARPHE